MEALDEGIPPRAAWRATERVAMTLAQPLLQGHGNELRTVVTTEESECTTSPELPDTCPNWLLPGKGTML